MVALGYACCSCKRALPESAFYPSAFRGTNKRVDTCKECRTAAKIACHAADPDYFAKYKRMFAKRRRERLERMKSAAGCCVCGERHPACLDWHHKDPDTKQLRIAQMLANGSAWAVIEAEIAKCTVICANCHRKLHYEAPVPHRARRHGVRATT